MVDIQKGLETYCDDPVLFVKDILGVEPDVWQTEALQALANNSRVAIRSGHITEKTLWKWLLINSIHLRISKNLAINIDLQHSLC